MIRVSAPFARHPHHSRWSGYPRLIEHLPGLVDIRSAGPPRLPGVALKVAAARTSHNWYGPPEAGADLAATWRLATARREVVHLLYPEHGHRFASRLPSRAARRANRLVVTFHHPPALLRSNLPPPGLLERIDRAIALGPVAGAHLAELLGSKRVARAYLGVDVDSWTPGGRRAEEPLCAFVGSWFRDFDLLEQVVGTVREARPEVRFAAVTSPVNRRRLDVAGLTTRSDVPDEALRELYRRAWVHVLPLTDAVACNALLEGMACGLPTVTTAVGDVESYTADASVLVPAGDAEAMAGSVLALLADASERERLGRAARERADELSLPRAAARHAEIYAQVI